MIGLRWIGGDGVGGGLVAAAGAALFAWTYARGLPYEAALIPRLAFTAMMLGGLWLLGRDILRHRLAGTAEPADTTTSWSEAATAAVVLATMLLAGWLVLRVGLATSVFVVLSATWLLMRRRFAPDVPLYLRAWRAFALAAGISAALYMLFILLLGIHLPRTFLF